MTNKGKDLQSQGRTDWGMNSASELATVYYYTCRSIRGCGLSTPPGDKARCIIVPIERHSGYGHFQ